MFGLVDEKKVYTVITVTRPITLGPLRRAAVRPGTYRMQGDITSLFRKTKDLRLLTSGICRLEIVTPDPVCVADALIEPPEVEDRGLELSASPPPAVENDEQVIQQPELLADKPEQEEVSEPTTDEESVEEQAEEPTTDEEPQLEDTQIMEEPPVEVAEPEAELADSPVTDSEPLVLDDFFGEGDGAIEEPEPATEQAPVIIKRRRRSSTIATNQ